MKSKKYNYYRENYLDQIQNMAVLFVKSKKYNYYRENYLDQIQKYGGIICEVRFKNMVVLFVKSKKYNYYRENYLDQIQKYGGIFCEVKNTFNFLRDILSKRIGIQLFLDRKVYREN